jgi:hypothetical protein
MTTSNQPPATNQPTTSNQPTNHQQPTNQPTKLAVPWVRWYVAGLSRRRLVFAPGYVHVEFVVDSVVLGQVLFRVIPFSPVALHRHISSWELTVSPLKAAVQRHSLTLPPRTTNQATNTYLLVCNAHVDTFHTVKMHAFLSFNSLKSSNILWHVKTLVELL